MCDRGTFMTRGVASLGGAAWKHLLGVRLSGVGLNSIGFGSICTVPVQVITSVSEQGRLDTYVRVIFKTFPVVQFVGQIFRLGLNSLCTLS